MSKRRYSCDECHELFEKLHVFENCELCAPCFRALSERFGYGMPSEGWPAFEGKGWPEADPE